MNLDIIRHLRRLIDQAPVWILLILGLWLVILRPLGPNLALIPGDLGDTRFNNYILEHFFRWVTGLTRDYWNVPFFFPFQQVTAFSDNLLGSAPFYALFRSIGLNKETAFQSWYILGYMLNFTVASYVLWRLKFKPLAVGTGAFFFAFGLPLLAQENHPQLLYRFCIPLAAFSLWRFYQAPRPLAGLPGHLAGVAILSFYLHGILHLSFAGCNDPAAAVLRPSRNILAAAGAMAAMLDQILVPGSHHRADISPGCSGRYRCGLYSPVPALLSRFRNLWFCQGMGGGF